MFNQKYIILFIDHSKIQLYGGNLTGIVTIEIPESILTDGDILRRDDLYTLIKQCVKQYALIGGQLIIVLSEAMYFEKMFLSTDTPKTESDILKFFDSIPYESTWTKVYQTEKGKHAVAVNKVLYEAFHQGFLLQGLSTKALIPSFILGPVGMKRALDRPMADHILGNVEAVTKQSLLDAQELGISTPQEKLDANKNKPKSNVGLLLGVFGVLLVVFLIVVITQLL
jgi:hypothetical protein